VDARQTYSSLGETWQACLDEAWASWARGSAGVGAVITDAVGSIVARGRNRMLEQPTEPGMLAGTSLAHAEMNALAQVPLGGGADWSLYTRSSPA
jgi:tRNA(adenine34) deaminase